MENKTFKYLTYGFALTCCILFWLSIFQCNVQAADKYQIINVTQEAHKVGNVKFSAQYSDGKWHVYYQKNNEKKKLISNMNSSTVLMTNGKNVYYQNEESTGYLYTGKIYKMNLSTGKSQHICSVSGVDYSEFAGIDSNNLYYVKDLDPGALYSYNFRTGLHKKLLDNVTGATQYGSVFLCTPYEGAGGPLQLQVYNTKTGHGKQISNGMIGYRVIKNKIYYVECIKDNDFNDYTCNVIRCDMNGKHKKILLKNRRMGVIKKITSKYVTTYSDFDGKTHKYIFSNK